MSPPKKPKEKGSIESTLPRDRWKCIAEHLYAISPAHTNTIVNWENDSENYIPVGTYLDWDIQHMPDLLIPVGGANGRFIYMGRMQIGSDSEVMWAVVQDIDGRQ